VYVTNTYGSSNPQGIGSGANITILSVPSVPTIPVTINSGTNIVITWTAPASNSAILNYTITIACAGGQWATTTYCNGADATTMANMYCTIP
jgi:hypothetical protein